MPPRKPSDQPMYRALPLLLSDLPRTRISVLQSSIRPNERGKDVLNFVIEVAPGSDKEPWKVEKLYSDVLGLDHRVRAAVGRSVSKKIATLPEGKMWRDHAPAKADLRKAALESYLTSLINLPIKNKDEVIAFFTSDIVRPSLQPVAQAGYKQGYLTKRGRNFGGWKSRYFVVQGPVLEYYESRGGGHLGSISITGAQIGRQQRSGNERREADDDNEYRHAFLIIEARKLPNGQHPRHVLCAESDEERDSWVEVLVRYVHGSYNEDTGPPAGAGQQAQVPGPINVQVQAPPRASSSSAQSPSDEAQVTPMGKKGTRTASKDNIVFGGAVPIAQLTPDAGNAKLMQAAPYPAALTIPIQQQSKENAISPINGPGTYSTSQMAKRILDGANASTPDVPVSTSLPESSPLSEAPGELVSIPRANSELGNYPDLLDPNRPPPSSGSPNDHRAGRKSYHPGLQTIAASPTVPVPPVADRPVTPESTPVKESKGKISGAFSGARLPGGFKFGSSTKEVQSSDAISTTSSTDRREKAKSRSFWGFGNKPQGSGADKPMPVSYGGRPVFGVPIEDALDVVQIGGLPAIAFRCIQYLETKKAEQEEGIYRLSGSSAVIKALKDRFNAEGDVDLLASDEYWDPHAIAGLLKTYLRELPTSVLTRDLHLRFLAVMDLVDQKERVHELKRLISRLPIANYSLLRALTAHLILIVQNSSINKMTMRNVGIVFSPTLGIPAGVFSLMLGEFNQVFNVSGEAAEEEESEPPSPDYEEDDVAPSAAAERAVLSRRNSHRYSDAAADQLLGLSGRTLAVPDESDEENASILIQEDSGSETAENETTESSTSAGRMPTYQDHLRPSDDPEQPSRSKAAAASRGLNITTGADRIRRQSRMIGLPHSPRPLQQNAQITSPNAPRSPSVPSSPVDTPK
ncbi:RhoGAP-domain-containing protein [Punctularia strigosozonata HHB-11173 SS5]|uniref:RhoGAP-domain-containing protein n=1 Tax=Punctularia strigosozonata (strain HHB-11173) TaxID=741275 RepID=UPI0004417A8F|nr:RhoGAP-domain-containing protein [Punctularia strigosozonata HHB-11173 SS5]EIN06173.1 RhoGAP-domain-containing protein [Punctularia strigosozonata HHB-11173 SS5]